MANSHFQVGLLEDFENPIEGALQVGGIGHVDDEPIIAIGTSGGMAVPEENVDELLAMVGPWLDVERFEIRRAEKLSVDGKRANGRTVAVSAEFIENDMLGDGIGILDIK